ncbi:hypothetical protein SGRIM119S_00078 [Streptomyces griseorubiginosus]
MFAVASMFGFESTAIYGEEAREPRKTVPRAAYASVTLIAAFLAFTTWMLVSAHGASQATSDAGKALQSGDATSFVFAPITSLFGGWAGDVLPILLVTSLFAGILAFHNSANRYLFSLGRDGLLPSGLTVVNRRHSPWGAGAAQTVISVLLVMPFAVLGKDPVLTLFSWLSGVSVLGVMLLYFLTSVWSSCLPPLARRHPPVEHPDRPRTGRARHRRRHLDHRRQLRRRSSAVTRPRPRGSSSPFRWCWSSVSSAPG